MERFATVINGLKPLAIVANISILDVCEDPGKVSDLSELFQHYRKKLFSDFVSSNFSKGHKII